jgi:prepilin-type N-terminal cleavage/methylation domain-containing protein
MTATTQARDQAGFSLAELLVAMVITMIVSGAIYGLMASGQDSFRREPELTDRQQNIRIAMDLLSRDVTTAGMGVPTFGTDVLGANGGPFEIFTIDDGGGNFNGRGPNPAALPSASDYLELTGSDGTCAAQLVCAVALPTVTVAGPAPPACFTSSPLVALKGVNDGFVAWLDPTSAAASNCPVGGGPAQIQGAPATTYTLLAGGRFALPAAAPNGYNLNTTWTITPVQVVRYEVRMNPGPNNTPGDADDVGDLWRSPTGGTDRAGASNMQLVARGLEDLQVRYRDGNGWADNARASVFNDLTTIVREVRVTLQARTLGPRDPRRGQLTTVVSPRAALYALRLWGTWQ